MLQADGTATEVSDYVASSGYLDICPGETTKTVPVTVVQDDLNELDETVTVTLSAMKQMRQFHPQQERLQSLMMRKDQLYLLLR